MLAAAAQETGLLATLETSLTSCTPITDSRLAHISASSCRMLLLTLLFLEVVGLRRTWDLRRYTGDALGLLTGRERAYGYFHTERFLAEVAGSNGAEKLTNTLAQWTTRLWQPADIGTDKGARFYIDGHRKPVYADVDSPWLGRAAEYHPGMPGARIAA